MTLDDNPRAWLDAKIAEHMNLMLDWAEGRLSYNNTILGLSDNRPDEIAAIARADAAEVAKHAAAIEGLTALRRGKA